MHLSFQIWALLAVAAATLVILGLAAINAFGRVAQRRLGAPTLSLPVQPDQTPLDRAIAPLMAERPAESGLLLLTSSPAALRARLETARLAGRSLDLQYYFWKSDLSGQLLMREVVAAAERGVRVRLLLDDINSFGFDPSLLALDSHPNIEVRLFNPSRSGDEYFDASAETNFHDIDVLAVGDCLEEAQANFDRYWNSQPALPIRSLHKLRRLRRPRFTRLVARLDAHAASERAVALLSHVNSRSKATDFTNPQFLSWSKGVEVMADPPEKAAGQSRNGWMGARINGLIAATKDSLLVSSPYFIPGSAGARTLAGLAAAGASIRILTNSLAATDVIAVHGAYARYRHALLAAGVQLHEMKPEPKRRRASLFGSRTASLHTKAFLIDDRQGFVGSFNLDPRSASINTEMGLLFCCPHNIQQLRSALEAQMQHDFSYSLRLHHGRLVWTERRNGLDLAHASEPEAPLRRYLPAWLISWLPIESQL